MLHSTNLQSPLSNTLVFPISCLVTLSIPTRHFSISAKISSFSLILESRMMGFPTASDSSPLASNFKSSMPRYLV